MRPGQVKGTIKKIFKWTFILLALYTLYIVGFVYFTNAIPMQPTAVNSAPQGIAVFTGTRARLQEGFETLRRYPESWLLISGVNEGTSISQLVAASRAKCCPPAERVTLDYKAQDTFENAQETAKWAKANNVTRLCLITSNYHMPRSILELSHSAPELDVTPHPVIANSFQDNTWWKNRVILYNVLGEYNKYVWAWIRYNVVTLFT
jgi:uncharacterized SAM-binding protein YcdF (DUF218 family)